MHGFPRAFLDNCLASCDGITDHALHDLAGNSFTSGPFLAILIATLLFVPKLPAWPVAPVGPPAASDADLEAILGASA